MKLNPQQAPLYGDSVLTVQLTEDKELEGGDAVFYLLFTGSTLNHLTSTRKVNAATLETVTPGHDCCERVKVSLCASRKGFSVVVAENNFDFVQDEAYDSAQFLAANADNQQALIFARFLDRSRPSPGDVTVLDEKITLAFRHLHLPSDWNVLGGNPRIKDVQLQETLMHFAARLGLCRLSKFLLEQPGGRRALAVPNNEGATPLSLALERGFLKLHHLLTVEEAGQQDFESEASHVERVGDSCVKHHCGLNVYTLSKKSQDETNMENRIEELNSYIRSHSNCPGNRVRAEQETALEQTTDLCHFHDDLQNCPVDKTLSPGKTVLSDAKNTDSPDLPLADAEKSKKESFVELDNTMETVGEEVAVFSFESKNKDIEAKEEEVGSAPIVESENVSPTSDYIQSLSSDRHTVESLLSGQNRNEETGMTSPGIVLDQEGLCERDSTSQEMITTEETASVNASAKEARNQASDLTNNSSATMGQAVSGYCTSAEEAQSYTESSDQETSETEPLLNLPTYSLSNSVDITDVSSDQEMSVHALQQCNTLDPEQTDPTAENGLVGLDTPNGIEGNKEKPLDNCLDILNKSIILVNEPELPDVIMVKNGLHFPQESTSTPTPVLEPSVLEASNTCMASITGQTDEKTNIFQNQLDTLDLSESDQQQNILETEIDKVLKPMDSHNLDIKAETPLSEFGESIKSAELSGRSLSEKAQSKEADLCHNKLLEESSSLTFQSSDTGLLTECKEENINSAADEPNQSLTNPSIEFFVADLLQGIITELEMTTSPVLTEKEQMLTCVENVKLPPAGQAAPLHSELSVCAEGVLSRDMDTPSLFNNNDCLQNQEVVTEHSVYKHASTEMQEAAVTTTCQANIDQEQLIDCEQDQKNGVLYMIYSEPDTQRAQDHLFNLPLFSQSEVTGSDKVEQKPQTKEDCTGSSEGVLKPLNSNNLQTNESKRALDECSAESMVENEVEMAQAIPPNDLSDLEPPCLLTCEKEEPEEVVKDSVVEDDTDEEDPEILKLSRASLHPIAEESLQNGDSSSDTASTCSDSEVSSDSINSEKTAESDEEVPDAIKQKVDLVDQLSHNEEVSTVSLLKGPSSTPGVEDGLVTDPGLLVSKSPQSVLQSDTLQDKCNDVQDPSDPTCSLKEEDSGLDLSVNMDEIACPSVSDTDMASENQAGKTEDDVDFVKQLWTLSETQAINRDICCPIDQCSHTDLLGPKETNNSTDCKHFLEDGLETGGSSQPSLKQDSASDPDLTCVSSEVLDEMLFTKLEEQSPCDATSSSSSTDDTASLERHSSRGSDISLPHGLNTRKHKNRHSLDSCCSSTVTASVDERESEHTEVSEMEGEEMDSITEVSMPSSRSKNSMRSLSPFRRHSWEPGKHTGNDTEINRRSSLRALGDVVRRPSAHRRSYSLEGLAGDAEDKKTPGSTLEASSACSRKLVGRQSYEGEDRGSLVSLTEEEQESEQRMNRTFQHEDSERAHMRGFPFSSSAPAPHLTKSMSLSTISHSATETQGRIRPKRRISFSFSISPLVPKSKHMFSVGSSSSDEESDSSRSLSNTSSSLSQSISEESCTLLPTSPSRKDIEAKSGTKVSRTFSYLRNKMSSGKKTKEKEKEKEKTKEKDKDPKEKERDKKTVNGHLFSSTPLVGPISCNNCSKGFAGKDGYLCANCNSIVHKSCRENYTPCAKVKMKHQKVLQPHDTSSLPAVIMRNKGSQTKERPRSAIVAPDENTFSALISNRRPQTALSISKSISTQNIAGVGYDESILTTWRVLSQSTDSLHKICKVNESMESLVDEGMDLNEGQLMGEFEMDSRQLEAESWSQVVDSKFLRQLKKDVVKRQDVIYELMQTEMHHVRTLKIMSDVYSRGMVTELQFEQSVLEKIFPCLDDLLNIHSQFFQQILERKKESMADKSEKNFVIKQIGDILVNQFSGENAERMKKTYGKFCGHHNEAVNHFKDLLSKEKRFQAFIKKKMSSAVVRRLGIPECILLVTQRITKYPVLLQRILQYTKENEAEHQDVAQSLNLVKDVITAVNSKVSNYEKKMRLHEIYSKTDSKSIQRMKSGQMFAKEDLKRRKLVRDGSVFLKSTTGRLKEVLAVLLSDILVFLQEKDQKYVFASLDQKSTVISLKKLIVREVAHEEKGLFLITMGVKDPEMVEVHASSKEERNSWIQTIQDTINTMNKDEDEGVPSESEEERRILDTKARELKEQLQQKDQQIITLLKEKEKIFQSLTDCCGNEESSPTASGRMLFRADTEDSPRGEPVMKSAMKEVETLQGLVNKNLWSSVGQPATSPTELEPGVGPVSLPRRAETFGGFDSHQLNVSKVGEKEEGEDTQDLRRTESDSVLKKGTNANLMFKRNSEQVLQSVTNLHKFLSTLQVVVLQQDTYIEDQKLHLNERALTRTSSRPNSLIEQEKQRSLEKQRQELANLQKQQAQHLEEKRKKERQWEAREKELAEREARLAEREELARKGVLEVEQERAELQNKKDEYQRDLERLRTAQKQLEKEREQMKKDMENVSEKNRRTEHSQVSCQHDKLGKMPSLTAGTDCKWHSSSSSKPEHLESELSASPKKESLLRTDSKQKGKSHFPWHSTNQTNKVSKPKEKKDKKKGKGVRSAGTDTHTVEGATPEEEIFC